MSWFENLMPSRIKTKRRTRSVPEGLWSKCGNCGAALYRAELERNLTCERTQSALDHKRSKGQRIGSIPYGQQLAMDNIHLIPN